MQRSERIRHFRQWLEDNSQGQVRFSQGTGISNSPTIVELGLELICADLENSTTPSKFIFWGAIGVPPRHEVFIAAHVGGADATAVSARLVQMATRGASDPGYSSRNNNVAILVSNSDGKLYLRNKLHWTEESDPAVLASFGPAISVERVEVAIYPADSSASHSLQVRSFIAYLKDLFRLDIHEVRPWPGEEVSLAAPNLIGMSLQEIKDGVKTHGGYYQSDLLERFHIGLNCTPNKHFLILSGVSGTGKSSLIQRYALAAYKSATIKDLEDKFYFMCSVRPDWTDNTSLLGYYDVILQRYTVPRFLEAVLAATARPNHPVFVCLDELNLARVEYYLSDLLSCMELGTDIALHSNPLSYEGTNGMAIPATIPFPKNLYLIGTINTDETTHQVSDKVLDRAQVLDLSEFIDLDGFLTTQAAADPGIVDAVQYCAPVLASMNKVLQDAGLAFGYRTAKEIVLYCSLAKKLGVADMSQTLDRQLIQKVMVKLRGGDRQRDALQRLEELVSGFPMTLRVLRRMLTDLEEVGAFQY
ncbi:McrB family protein [Bradyrhizobium yuanmingense]|uniref:McrB family protein n=1 Tax=Bradyrhizobium yuanmingense TaxID=108015 RepID=UPI0004B6194D|nr:hypothetical protein [Bradyrhizobium yuanmingense]